MPNFFQRLSKFGFHFIYLSLILIAAVSIYLATKANNSSAQVGTSGFLLNSYPSDIFTVGAQSGGAQWNNISGDAYISGKLGIGVVTTPYKFNIQGGHGDTSMLLHSTGNGTPAFEADLFLWASEPGCTWSGVGIGNNIRNYNGGSNCFPRINTARGGSYIHMYENTISLNTVSNTGIDTTTLYINGGNVGIGTTAPGATLDVNGMAILGSSSQGGLRIQSMDTNTVNLRPSIGNGDITITDDSAQATRGITIANGGSLGIATAAPTQRLEVVGNAYLSASTSLLLFPEISANTSYFGLSTNANGLMSDGVPWYFGIGREPGAWAYPFPDLVISNHTGVRLAAHSGYGGVSIYEQYDGTNWSSKGTEIARFTANQWGGPSYVSQNFRPKILANIRRSSPLISRESSNFSPLTGPVCAIILFINGNTTVTAMSS